MSETTLWDLANRNLVAKAIGELTYEEVLAPRSMSKDEWVLELKSGVVYEFKGRLGIWSHLKVDASSILRKAKHNSSPLEAAQFFIDAQSELEMTDIVLGNFLEEMYSTLHGDVILLNSLKDVSAKSLLEKSGDEIQVLLNGHPKILLNKGRMGWSASDFEKYAPESGNSFQLFWIALEKSRVQIGTPGSDLTKDVLEKSYLECLNLDQLNALKSQIGPDDVLLPVHPWQWDRVIRLQYQSLIADGSLKILGLAGDFYRPQISIRTLSNVTRPGRDDIKLPLSILNTSAVRGISSRYIKSAPKMSYALADLCGKDDFLKSLGTDVLRENLGITCAHPHFTQVQEAPYRYHETLGAIWRQSSLNFSGKSILTASLFFKDLKGNSFIGSLIKASDSNIEDWLSKYFDVVVIPLYHLQLRYGIGLVAHGQNIILRLENNIPSGVLLKDFHGDLRLSEDAEIDLGGALDRLPKNYLIHDLITGHFVTVLRFISETLRECDSFEEKKFYAILADRIRVYESRMKHKNSSLLREKLERVLLNKVRFQIGYADSSVRPKPLLGSLLNNPLYSSNEVST